MTQENNNPIFVSAQLTYWLTKESERWIRITDDVELEAHHSQHGHTGDRGKLGSLAFPPRFEKRGYQASRVVLVFYQRFQELLHDLR